MVSCVMNSDRHNYLPSFCRKSSIPPLPLPLASSQLISWQDYDAIHVKVFPTFHSHKSNLDWLWKKKSKLDFHFEWSVHIYDHILTYIVEIIALKLNYLDLALRSWHIDRTWFVGNLMHSHFQLTFLEKF